MSLAARYEPQPESLVSGLIIPFDGTGYVALHEIVSTPKVVVPAVHHQREEDDH
jgi:hypothetical protein